MKRITVIWVVSALLVVSGRGQGYINLNFESASAQNLTNNAFVAVTNALPGWAGSDGPNSLPAIYYETNHPYGGTAVVLDGASLALSGNFSVFLDFNGSISQTGLVPTDAQSLQFWALGAGAGGSLGSSGFRVSLGGQTLAFSVLSQSPSYWMYGVNIPAGMAGQMEALNFFITDTGGVRLDNIAFSPLSIPEPSGFALFGLGAILLRLCRHRLRR